MKTHDSLRPTISTPSWFWRAAAALLALVALLAGIGMARMARPVAQTSVVNPSAPIGSGSVHDGSAYVAYLLRREPIETSPAVMHNPNIPISGTGSAYDGGSYGTAPSVVPNASVPTAQNRSSHDSSVNAEYIEYLTGRPLRDPAQPTVAPNPNIPISGTGSAYQP